MQTQRIGVLFVCLGNICRSPLAQAVFEHELMQAGLHTRFITDSCGTAAFNAGKPPDPRAIAAASARGYSIEAQRARQIDDTDFRRFRHIIAMDHANLHTLRGWAPADFGGELHLLMHFSPAEGNTQIADPYYLPGDAFGATLAVIERGVRQLLIHLCETYPAPPAQNR